MVTRGDDLIPTPTIEVANLELFTFDKKKETCDKLNDKEKKNQPWI